MEKNESQLDRGIRMVIAIFLALMSFYALQGLWMWLVLAIALVLFVTSLMGTCFLYSVFGINTNKNKVEK